MQEKHGTEQDKWKMNKDVIIVDDDTSVLRSLCAIIRTHDLHPIAFSSPSESLDHLKKREEQPLAYFVDMRIPGELDGSRKIFDYVAGTDKTKNFFYITGHLSEHDEEEIQRTGANHLIKNHDCSKLCSILEGILDTIAH